MSSFDRRVFLLSVTALAGCGFEPVYGPDAPTSDLRGRIDIVPPEDEEGFALVRRLEDRLGRGEAPEFLLLGDIRISEEAVGFLPDGSISRYTVLGAFDWRLVRIADETLALSGLEQNFTSYSATSTTVATTTAQRAARERLMVSLADRVTADILARGDAL